MASNKLNQLKITLILVLSLCCTLIHGQAETSKWKALVAFGVNNPIDDNDNDNFYSKNINFPTINLGVQRMFTRTLGAKVDYSFNRAKNADGSSEFKLNYSRVNAQLVYDTYQIFNFMPQRMNLVGHMGPGLSFTKPLSPYTDNTYTFLNVMAGIELHYGISEGVSIYGDVSYIMGLSNKQKYDPAIDGFSFNGDLLTISVGVAVSLSGCYYCE